MFKITYGVNTDDRFDYSTKTAIELALSSIDHVNIDDVFNAIAIMIDSNYEQFIDRNSQLYGFGYGEEVTITVIALTNDYVKLELHW